MTQPLLPQRITLLFLLSLAFLFQACEEPVFTPKPRGYPKVEYPEKGYTDFSEAYCDLEFRYPSYAKIMQDSLFFDQLPQHPCWFDLYIPAFDCRLHCSYLEVGKQKSFDELRSDAFDLANWHNKKANYIEETAIANRYGAEGMIFEFDGPVASPIQFYLTDPKRQHFLRASLYFNTEARPDSIQPVYNFVRQDLDTMIATFRWGD
ncbi:MAG: hypothetical protein AAGH79_07580 [Bacteroidota bacterium]